jgi:hypothetical protein
LTLHRRCRACGIIREGTHQCEVDGGINSVTAALGDAKALSPFFRIPYLGRTNAIERFLERKQLVTWSAVEQLRTFRTAWIVHRSPRAIGD